jgi:hypothetical protein
MGKSDWSQEQLERDLAAGFHLLGRAERSGGLDAGESAALADGVLQCMNSALQKVSESLEAQSRMRGELAQVREDLRRAAAEQAERIAALEGELASLRLALDAERGRTRAEVPEAEGDAHVPSDEYLARPLVLRSPQGDFLGVTDRFGQALSLYGLVRLAEGATPGALPGGRVVASCWEACGGGWCLTICISSARVRRCYAFETVFLRTPSGNNVTLLSGMRLDGDAVPQEYLLQMFRQLRDSLQEE